jgi:hypothetical protein
VCGEGGVCAAVAATTGAGCADGMMPLFSFSRRLVKRRRTGAAEDKAVCTGGRLRLK